jgi:hypothetical protein
MAAKRNVRRIVVMTPGSWFLRAYAMYFGIAALIGLAIGIVWTIAGLLHVHRLW